MSRLVSIRKSNLLMDLQKMQKNLIFCISVDILQSTSFFSAFTASADVPSIYIHQFWNTLTMDTKSGIYSFQLDELWFILDADLLRSALGITPKDSVHPFVAPPAGDLSWRTILFMINQCLMVRTSGSDRPGHQVLQLLWGVIMGTNIDYVEFIWEEFVQAIKTFFSNAANLKMKTPATQEESEESTGHSAQPQDDTSANVVYDISSPVDSTSKADTKILNVEEEHGEEVSHTVALEERTIELDEGRAISDLVHENLKVTTKEQVHMDNLPSSFETLLSMKNLDDAFTFGDQFLNDKSSKGEPGKANVETKVESMASMDRENKEEFNEEMTKSLKRCRDDQDPPLCFYDPRLLRDSMMTKILLHLLQKALTEARRKGRIMISSKQKLASPSVQPVDDNLIPEDMHLSESEDTGAAHLSKIKTRPDDKDNQKKMTRETEVHKFSDGMLMRILEKLDYMFKDNELFKFNPNMENRIWTEDDKRRSQEFIKVVERRLKISVRRSYALSWKPCQGDSLNLPDHSLIIRNKRYVFKHISDASNQGRRIHAIDADKDITLVSVQDDADKEMFDVDTLVGEEVFVAGKNENVVEEVVDVAQDNGKGIIIEGPMKPKKKDQIRLDEEAAKKLHAKFDEEERLKREKAKKEERANIALIEEWDDIQAKIDADHQLAERLQAQEQEDLSDAKKATLFQQLLEKRRKHFAAKRA
nr:hypothetical protein [Tanacetum cinerariifolium]